MKLRGKTQPSPIQHQRLRAPEQNNSALHRPPLSEASDWVSSNQSLIAEQAEIELPASFLNPPPEQLRISYLRSQAKRELLSLALDYSGRYLAAPPDQHFKDINSPIIMSGHQPELFHPGVWYKNFALSKIAQEQNGVAINLVVDSDLAHQNSIRFPDLNSTPARTGKIAFDRPSTATPFELRPIVDLNFFSQFPDRVNQKFNLVNNESTGSLIVHKLWAEVLAAAAKLSTNQKAPNLGAAIAAGRHRLEQKLGLKTIEVPVSLIANSNTFASFAAVIFNNRERFRSIYNLVIDEYRSVHRIRSQSHPVPQLKNVDDWSEIPFWIYSSASPERQKLFVKSNATQMLLTDFNDHAIEISKANFIDEFLLLNSQGIYIRPRALLTTMFSRLFLSDIFLHGIGGAKYDQLTDAISARFFGYQLPHFLTLSATMTLPSRIEPIAKPNINRLRQRRRRLKFHPERFFDANNSSDVSKRLIAEKQRWTSPEMQHVRTQEKHDTIKLINQKLNKLLVKFDNELADTIALQQRDLHASQIAHSREYSFCLFDSELASGLQSLVDKNFEAK